MTDVYPVIIAAGRTMILILIAGIAWNSFREPPRRIRTHGAVDTEHAAGGSFMLKLIIVAFLAGLAVAGSGLDL